MWEAACVGGYTAMAVGFTGAHARASTLPRCSCSRERKESGDVIDKFLDYSAK